MKLKLLLAFFRWAGPWMARYNWRGKLPTALVVSNETMAVDGGRIKLRVFRPLGEGPFPILHFFHGGGFAAGDLDTHDPLCRDLCVQSGRLVVAFDYRLAPEHPFPIPINDCLASLSWIKANAARLGGDAGDIVLCGDSAGGNLAAVCAQQARSLQPGLIKGQVLIYPATDHGSAQWRSYETHGGPEFGLSRKMLGQLWDLYVGNSPIWIPGAKSHDLATPLHVKDLAQLPRALFVIAEEDLLKDEATEYARLMTAAGNEAQVRRFAGELHGFVGLKPNAGHRQAVADIVAWLKQG